MYVEGGNGRFVDDEGARRSSREQLMYIVDDADQSFVAFDKATMEQLAKQIGAAMDRAKEQLAKLPPSSARRWNRRWAKSTGEDADEEVGGRSASTPASTTR
jgi:hypothetical protein